MPRIAEHYNSSRSALIPLHLWFTYPGLISADEASNSPIISDEEIARSRALKFERDRREYLTSRLLVRNALSHYHPNPPRIWRFQANPYGKPALEPDCGLRFNLSNCADLVVCVIGRGMELGIDAEPLTRASQAASVSGEFLSSSESDQLDELPEEEKLDRALSLWTLKESYIKARGLGLSLPLKEVSFAFDKQGGIRMDIHRSLNDSSSNWQFCLFDLAEHRIAVFAESKKQPKLEVWEAHPLVEAPVRLLPTEQVWFPLLSAGE